MQHWILIANCTNMLMQLLTLVTNNIDTLMRHVTLSMSVTNYIDTLLLPITLSMSIANYIDTLMLRVTLSGLVENYNVNNKLY